MNKGGDITMLCFGIQNGFPTKMPMDIRELSHTGIKSFLLFISSNIPAKKPSPINSKPFQVALKLSSRRLYHLELLEVSRLQILGILIVQKDTRLE